MKFCLGTVCWGGYLERYVNVFAENYITIFRKLISAGINCTDIADPRIFYANKKEEEPEIIGENTEKAIKYIETATGKNLKISKASKSHTDETIMYATRNGLRGAFRKAYPEEPKVFFYFPIDDLILPEVVEELIKLSHETKPTACMFKFRVKESVQEYKAFTRPIKSPNDIFPGDWGGYCAYNILNEDDCPLYPKVAIPNIAFYIELYKAGYDEYLSKDICIKHLRHKDSHHYKTKNTEMSMEISKYLSEQKRILKEMECD